MFKLSLQDFKDRQSHIGVVGLGYVGLPLLIAFEKYFSMKGFDVSEEKICLLKNGRDLTGEVGDEALNQSSSTFSADPEILKECSVIIVAVPTPIDEYKTPDLSPVISATRLISKNLKKGSVIVYESTVYPGVTEEVCKPILEEAGLIYGEDFFLGYSPERINPGDKSRCFESILKIVSGDREEVTEFLGGLYGTVVHAGVHLTSSIKVAEAAKVIENIQRDVNIALMNELSILFNQLGIDTSEVLEAAGTKWNFIRMSPGLVGGHCIGVDPYYLTHKAEQIGYHPQIITAGRRINDGMSKYVAEQTVKLMIHEGILIKSSKVLVLGLTFKEDVPDTRNSKVKELIEELASFGCDVYAADYMVEQEELEHGFRAKPGLKQAYDVVVLAVPHKRYLGFMEEWNTFFPVGQKGILIDIKAAIGADKIPPHVKCWRL